MRGYVHLRIPGGKEEGEGGKRGEGEGGKGGRRDWGKGGKVDLAQVVVHSEVPQSRSEAAPC